MSKCSFNYHCVTIIDCNYRQNYFYSLIPLLTSFSIITASKLTQTLSLTSLNFTNLHLLNAFVFFNTFFTVIKLLAQSAGSGFAGNASGGTFKRLEALPLQDFTIQDYMWQRLMVAITTSGYSQAVNQEKHCYNISDLSDTM